MPIYEYRCKHCESTFPKLQKVGASGEGIQCPECGSADVERMLSAFASGSSSEGAATSSGGAACTGFT